MQESKCHFQVVSLLRIEITGEHSQLHIVSKSHPGFAAVAFECEKFHHPKVPPKRITANYYPPGNHISHPRALLSRWFSELPQVGYVSFLPWLEAALAMRRKPPQLPAAKYMPFVWLVFGIQSSDLLITFHSIIGKREPKMQRYMKLAVST